MSTFVDFMTVFPQRCVITGYGNRHNQAPVLDLQKDIPEYGRLYITRDGMDLLAAQFGFTPDTEVHDAIVEFKTDLEQAQLQIAEKDAQLARIPAVIEGTLNGLQELSLAAVAGLLAVGGVPDGAGTGELGGGDLDGNEKHPAPEGAGEGVAGAAVGDDDAAGGEGRAGVRGAAARKAT